MDPDRAGWRTFMGGAAAWFGAPSHSAGAALVRRLAGMAGLVGAELRASGVRVRVDSDRTATAIASALADPGLVADPASLQALRLVIDTPDAAAIEPFWTALAYRRDGDDLIDVLRREPAVRLQRIDAPRPLRNRFHVDIGLLHADEVRESLARAGGVETIRADYYRTLADPDGNEVCLPVSGAAGLAEDLADWRALGCAIVCYRTESFGQAAEFATTVAALADEAGKSLLIDLRPDVIVIDSGKDQQEDENFGLDPGFAELAGRIEAAARDAGLTADPERLHYLQIAIDAVDIPAVRAFWMAVLGYRQDQRFTQDIYDPRRLDPVIWFQPMDSSDEERRAQRNRIHLDLFVAADHARSRVDAGVAAGGRIVDDHAPHRWTLADPEGNEIDILAGTDGLPVKPVRVRDQGSVVQSAEIGRLRNRSPKGSDVEPQ